MPFTKEEIAAIGSEEESRWQNAHREIEAEIRQTNVDYATDRQEAHRLTAEIVAAHRDEDKQALASDEAVAHGLTKLRKEKGAGLDGLLEQPYFARVITEEEGKEIEFRLGTASFPKERIIDWRKAPISRLYYDYKEGDDFSEHIQGRDREGKIKLRRAYQGERENLKLIEMPLGALHKTKDVWEELDRTHPLSRSEDHDGRLPPILSLITPEQFALITNDADKPLVIQGVAGSGKTTVALHRLAWLLHESNSDCQPEQTLVVMYNRALKTYVESTLPELDVRGVPIKTFYQWAHQLLSPICGPRPKGKWTFNRHLEMFKSSPICLEQLQSYASGHDTQDFVGDLFGFFRYLVSRDLFWPQWDKIRARLQEQIQKRETDYQDDALLLHLYYERKGCAPKSYDHIVIDEVQDFGAMEILALLNSLKEGKTVTLVGDMGQQIAMARQPTDWKRLLKDAGLKNLQPINMTVAHRATREIMELADHLRSVDLEFHAETQTTRRGPRPVFLRAESREVLIPLIGKWIGERLTENPRTFCAVICRTPREAEKTARLLRKEGCPSVRWGHRDQFDFSPGVTVTNTHQVKGLEFRNVLVVEPSTENYHPDNGMERNLLYVAVTRAEVRLDFIGVSAPTPMLPEIETIYPQLDHFRAQLLENTPQLLDEILEEKDDD